MTARAFFCATSLSLFASLAACGGRVDLNVGTSNPPADGGGDDGGTSTPTCAPAACGEKPPIVISCPDGSTAGYTDRCLKRPDGTCGWEYRSCPTAASCGGLKGELCPSGQYCDYGRCPVPDAMGTCKAQPTVCDKVLAPVCGCDGKTYDNACEAQRVGVTKAGDGACGSASCGLPGDPACPSGLYCAFADYACPAPGSAGKCTAAPGGCTAIYQPVCGCDGATYGNSCDAHMKHATIAADGPCPSPPTKICGGFPGTPCAPNEYCDFGTGFPCGGADNTGICKVRPEICSPIAGTVCGCDGKTYESACAAHANGTDVTPCGKGI